MKNPVRVKGAGWTNLRRAKLVVERGTARWIRQNREIEMIPDDHRVFCITPAAGFVQLPQISFSSNVGDSGQSVYPIIGYHRESTERWAA